MCGIAGIVTPGEAVAPELVERMVAAMAHRGPDGSHLWCEHDVALGVARLAIVDVAGGAQPLGNESRTVRVLFNGEIYNHERLRRDLSARGHRFESRTDGAVIPHLYEELGDRLFDELDGIFAIAVYDSAERTLLLARDRFGVKPLYVHRSGSAIRFASELRALLSDPAVPRELDPIALDQHLTFRFTPAPRTLLAGVEKLLPATVLSWREGVVRTARYWRTAPPQPSRLSFGDAADEFRARLRNAVHRQMMSDRPIGAMLSGGIDSAAVVALMAERSSPVRTFTVGFEGGGDADETALARQTAERFGTEHHELIVGRSDFASELPSVIESLEEPVATSSAIGFRAVARLARPEVPVLLSGQGADELLGGYWRYVGEWIAGGTATWLPRLARVPVRSARLERGLRAVGRSDTLERFMHNYAVFTEDQKRELYGPDLSAATGTASRCVERLRLEAAARRPLDQMLYVDLRLWLPDDLLLVADKMGMAASVETRVPFLDRALVDLVESLPSSYKLRLGRRKALEKAALAPLLPQRIIHRKERGFVTPLADWLRTDMHVWARELLLGSDSRFAAVLRRDAVTRLLASHGHGAFDHTRQIFCLLSLELWARRFLAPTAR